MVSIILVILVIVLLYLLYIIASNPVIEQYMDTTTIAELVGILNGRDFADDKIAMIKKMNHLDSSLNHIVNDKDTSSYNKLYLINSSITSTIA